MQQDPDLIARSAEELVGDLNPQQAEAVQYRGPALLIGAGAGSGKTRVLTRRIAWILTQFGAWPSQILAITFTNKAAAEMRERLEGLIGPVAQRMWVSTFHSACVRILRRDGQSIGLASGFSIYDTADCERLVKLIGADLNIDLKRYTPRAILSRISDYKNSLIGWQEQLKRYAPDYRPGQRGYQIGNFGDIEVLYSVIYAEYQHRLAMANAVDFDDLIGRTVELLRTQPQVADYYRHKFRYILVDEYQDTNHAQYELIRELAGVDAAGQVVPDAPSAGRAGPAWITVVGDSDQSIYAFRGADIRNIQDFEQDFPNAKTIMLEQNYRSTQTILDAANAVIANNQGRKPKKLWTALGSGDPIVGYAADNAEQEAAWIAGRSLASAPRRARRIRTWPSCTVPTRSRVRLKARSCMPDCRISWLAAHGSTSGGRSRTPSRICRPSSIRPTTSTCGASSTCPSAVSDLVPNRSSSHMPMLMRPRSGTALTILTRSTACPPAPASSSPHSGT